MIDYPVLQCVWWCLLGVLLIGFAVMDGFDLGVAMLLPFLGKTDTEKRIIINTIGPVWEGNQVWLILGAGAIFAAWPMIYAVAFSGMYFAMLIVLSGLILRPVAFKFRSKEQSLLWRQIWDCLLFISGFVPALIFGVALGNVLQGLPFYFDDTLRIFYTGSFWGLLNPFALFCGVLSVAMIVTHGGLYLAIKTENPISKRATITAVYSAFVTFVLFLFGGVLVTFFVDGYLVNSQSSVSIANPLLKTVSLKPGAWFFNYVNYPWLILVPMLGLFGELIAMVTAEKNPRVAFLASGVAIFGILASVGVSQFPFLLPSSSNPNHSLLVWDASSSQMTLFLMLIAVVVFIPIIIAYTSWVYWVLRGKVTEKTIKKDLNAY